MLLEMRCTRDEDSLLDQICAGGSLPVGHCLAKVQLCIPLQRVTVLLVRDTKRPQIIPTLVL